MLDTRGEQSLVSLFSFGGAEMQIVKIKNNVRKEATGNYRIKSDSCVWTDDKA